MNLLAFRGGINFDKVFPRLPIRWKLFISFVGLTLLPTLVVGGWAAWEVAEGLRGRALDSLAQAAEERAGAVEELFSTVEEDLRFLATKPEIADLGAAKSPAEKAAARASAEAAFLSFSQGRRAYYQIRYIDATGREVVRVDYRDGRAVGVAPEELQDKSDRYYVREALLLPSGAIYVSPMDLNVERGRVEDPSRPVVRYVLALGPAGGRADGLLVVNLFAEHVFALLAPLRGEGRVLLLDDLGRYLAASDGPRSPFSLAGGRRIDGDESVETVQAILAGAGGLLSPSGIAYGHAPIRAGRGGARRWTLAVAAPEYRIVGPARAAARAIAIGTILAAGVAAGLGAVAAGRLSRPLENLARAADRVATGDFDARVACETNDEIEDLCGRFNEMAGRLGRWNDDLRAAVLERTEDLGREKEKIEGIVAGMGGGLCLIDRTKSVVWANRTLLVERGEGIVGRPYAEAICGGRTYASYPADEAFAVGGVVRRRIVRSGADGKERHFEVVAAPVHDAAGAVGNVLELSIDVTESVRREEAAVRSERLASLGLLSAGVLHEVANPIAAIKTTLDVLKDGGADAGRVRRFADRAIQECDRLTVFLRSFSTFARPRPPERGAVDLAATTTAALALVEGEIRRREIDVETDFATGTLALADEGQVRQILLNLLLNAVEASATGGRIKIAVRPARLDGREAALLEVADEGAGMDEETRRRIFDPFFTTKSAGSGLGLAVVERIAAEHGGRVEVESGPGAGTRLRILLPASEGRGAAIP